LAIFNSGTGQPTSARIDPAVRRRRQQLLVAAVAAAAFAALPLGITNAYFQHVMIVTVLYMALSQSWNILGGYCGQISLGHVLYFGVGAYTSTILNVKYGIPPVFGMLVGGVFATIMAVIVGIPCFRLRGHYYAIATIVIAESALLLFLNWDWVGGALGIYIPFVKDSWLFFQFRITKLPFYYVILSLAAILWLITFWIEGSKWGFYWRAVKDNPEAAESLGVKIYPTKLAAAGISAFFTAIGGSFYAQYNSYIDPNSVLEFNVSLLMTLPAVLGGIGTLWGPAIGAIVLIPVTELTRSYLGGSGSGYDLIIYGSLIMLVATLKPEGLIGYWNDFVGRRKRRDAAAAESGNAA
jgi:branched-chain amino acid transport system permease protein